MDNIFIPHGIANLHEAREFVEFADAHIANKPFEMRLCGSEADWLIIRRGHIGASQAGTVLGLTDAWKTRRQLWEEFTGRRVDTFEGNEYTRRGQQEEPLIRALWAIEHPDWDVYDGTFLHFRSRTEPWRSCSLDMIAVERATGRIIVGEIKTGVWHKAWSGDNIPDAYLAQVSQQVDITQFAGAVVIARLMPPTDFGAVEKGGAGRMLYYSREELAENMAYVRREVNDFWASIQEGKFRVKVSMI